MPKKVAKTRDASPERKKKSERPVLLIFLQNNYLSDRNRPLVLEPDDYTDEEVKLLFEWTKSDDVTEDYNNLLQEEGKEKQADTYAALYEKLQGVVQAPEYIEFDDVPVRWFYIKIAPTELRPNSSSDDEEEEESSE